MKKVVVVPTYNEREGLPAFLARFPHEQFDLLVVDDSSPDGTADLVRDEATSRPWLHLVVRPVKDGLAGAYRSGFAWALENGYDVVGQMDSDLQHPPETLAPMLDALADADLVVGSRYVAGARNERLAVDPPLPLPACRDPDERAAAPSRQRSVGRLQAAGARARFGRSTSPRRCRAATSSRSRRRTGRSARACASARCRSPSRRAHRASRS